MDKILMKVRAILLYEHWTIEWMFRILFSINILMPAFTYDEHYYTIIVLGFSVVAFWLYIARLKVFAGRSTCCPPLMCRASPSAV